MAVWRRNLAPDQLEFLTSGDYGLLKPFDNPHLRRNAELRCASLEPVHRVLGKALLPNSPAPLPWEREQGEGVTG
jgi:hypothetical protein